MRARTIIIMLTLVGAVFAIAVFSRRDGSTTARQTVVSPARAPEPTATSLAAQRVPAFYKTPPDPGSLAPALSPEQFTGKTREAYRAVKEIPLTIAQIPCYCDCDLAHGHKSLHSCFEGTHASQCAVCVDEALVAYRLQKEQHLSPKQIRERIIAEYSSQ